MMNFRKIKREIVNILNANAKGCFTVIGAQKQVKSAEEVEDFKRSVQVFYGSGDFDESSGYSGSKDHNISFKLDLTLSKQAEGDISSLIDINANAVVREASLSSFRNASDLADDSFDEFVELVFQILMNPVNKDLNLGVGVIGKRWINNVNKDQPIPQGEVILLTGTIDFKVKTIEEITGEVLTTLATNIDTTIDIPDDDVEQTGVIVDIGG